MLNKYLKKAFAFGLLLTIPFNVKALESATIKGTLKQREACLNFNQGAGLWLTSDVKSNNGKTYEKMKSGNYVYPYNTSIWEVTIKSEGSSKNKTYNAYCIDPGLTANSNSTVYCEPIENSQIEYLYKNYDGLKEDDANNSCKNKIFGGLELALRALAIDANYPSENALEKNGYAEIKNRIINGQTTGKTIFDYIPSEPNDYMTKDSGFWESLYYDGTNSSKNTVAPADSNRVTKAIDFYGAAKGAGGGTGSAGTGSETPVDTSTINFTIEKISQDETARTIEYKITSNLTVKKESLNAVCEKNCTIVDGSFTWNDKEGRVKIHVNDDTCKGYWNLEYIGKKTSTESKSLYLCYRSNNGEASKTAQQFIVYMNSDDEKKIKKVDFALGECECDCSTIPEFEKLEIESCCEDNKPSEVIQPKINTLFCDYKSEDNEVIVHKYNSICAGDYKVENDNLESDYCELYCSERLKVTIPSSVQSEVGHYFELPSVTDDSKGPLFEGKRTCRLVIKYDQWANTYKTTTKNAVDSFNSYQSNKANHDMYDKMVKDLVEKQEDRILTHTYSETKEVTCSNGTKQNVTFSGTANTVCKIKGKKIEENSYKPVKYKQVKVKWNVGGDSEDPLSKYKGLSIVDSTDGATSAGDTGYYTIDWVDPNCKNVHPDSARCSATACDGSYQSICSYSSTTGDTLETPIKDTIDKAISDYGDNAEKAAKAYQTNVKTLEQLDKDLLECDNYFDEGGKGTKKNADGSYLIYDMKPTATFYYFQAYVDNSVNKIKDKEHSIEFTVKCEYNLTKVGETADDKATELGLLGYQYNTANGSPNTEAKVKNFVFGSQVKCLSNSGYEGCSYTNATSSGLINSSDTTYSQRYTEDAYYEARCTSNDINNNSHVIYPYGSIGLGNGDSGSYYYTDRDIQYYIEYSTLFATYETHWEFSGLGSIGSDGKGVFDKVFTEHDTCSGNTNTENPRLFCELKVDSELTEISGCNEDSVIAFLNGFDYNWKEECCDTPDCDNNSTDQLTYTFKIADSAALFPDGGNNNGKVYGYNWLVDSNGSKVKSEIEALAASGNTYNPSSITYEFDLSSQDLALIKKYNANNSYNDFNMTCEKRTETNPETHTSKITRIYECKSNFITNYYNGKIITDSDASTKLGQAKLDKVRTSNTHFHFYSA